MATQVIIPLTKNNQFQKSRTEREEFCENVIIMRAGAVSREIKLK